MSKNVATQVPAALASNLNEQLQAVPVLVDTDPLGNRQAAFSLLVGADGNLIVVVPDSVSDAVVSAAAAAALDVAATASAAAQNDRTIRDRLEQALTQLEGSSGTQAAWAALTAAQKDAVLRTTVRVVAGLVRLTLRRLDNPG
jgi:hypothetical protein